MRTQRDAMVTSSRGTASARITKTELAGRPAGRRARAPPRPHEAGPRPGPGPPRPRTTRRSQAQSRGHRGQYPGLDVAGRALAVDHDPPPRIERRQLTEAGDHPLVEV